MGSTTPNNPACSDHDLQIPKARTPEESLRLAKKFRDEENFERAQIAQDQKALEELRHKLATAHNVTHRTDYQRMEIERIRQETNLMCAIKAARGDAGWTVEEMQDGSALLRTQVASFTRRLDEATAPPPYPDPDFGTNQCPNRTALLSSARLSNEYLYKMAEQDQKNRLDVVEEDRLKEERKQKRERQRARDARG